MTKETVYPSQINTKTISCRISALDYVNFLQDALSKGITLNDWLLMRIYTQKSNLIGQEESNEDVLEFPFDISTNNSDYTFNDLTDIENFIIDSENKINELITLNQNITKEFKICVDNHKIKIDLNTKQDRAVVWGKIGEYIDSLEWETTQDKKEVKSNLRKLYNDLFE
jgi:hypothetical protein